VLGGRRVRATLVRCWWRSLFAMLLGARLIFAMLLGGRLVFAVLFGVRLVFAVLFGVRLIFAMLFGGQLIFAVLFGGRRFLSRPALDDRRALRSRRGALDSDAMTNERLGLRAVVNPTVPIVRVPVVIHVINRAPLVIVLGRDVDIDRRDGRVDVRGLRVGLGVAGGGSQYQSG
jgi:hypothetical protein